MHLALRIICACLSATIASLLFAATWDFDYEFYKLLRITICTILILFSTISLCRSYYMWSGAFLLFTILFNPFFEVYLYERKIWYIVDISLIALLVTWLYRIVFKTQKQKENRTQNELEYNQELDKLKKRFESHIANEKNNNELLEICYHEYDLLKKQINASEEKNYFVEEELKNLKENISSCIRNSPTNQEDDEALFLENFEDCIELGEKKLSNLEFSNAAKKSAKEAAAKDNIKSVKMLWDMLNKLDKILFDLRFCRPAKTDIEREFKALSGYEYARGEGSVTKATSRIVNSRFFIHKQRKYSVLAHIKPHGKRSWRIYFDFDNQNKKIVIGHVGDHLEVASTRKV